MSKFKTKAELVAEIKKERAKLKRLLDEIPEVSKTEEVTDGMSVKDFVAHRTEWGRMMIRWYQDARGGRPSAVPTDEFKWNQLKELNAAIHSKFAQSSPAAAERDFANVHDRLFEIVQGMSEEELFTKKHYSFTGTSDLATYVNSATASHYRSARRHIQHWWKSQTAAA